MRVRKATWVLLLFTLGAAAAACGNGTNGGGSTDAGLPDVISDSSLPDSTGPSGPSSDGGLPEAMADSGPDGPGAEREAGSDAALLPLLSGSVVGFSSAAPAGPSEQNPYGIAIVPPGIASDGGLSSGNILVSNFNGATNVQGTGTTIVNITPTGRSLFFTSALPGLSTALGVLKAGLVIVGNVPAASDGGVGMGALQVLDANGHLLSTITDATLLADPWDLAISDQGSTAKIFVSNVVTGTVTRLDATVSSTALTVTSKVQIASGYATRPDPAAFVVGPGGMVYDEVSDTLFLASTAEKVNGAEVGSVFSIAKAGTATTDGAKGTVFYADTPHLHGPIGLALAPNGHLLVANSDAVNADPTQPSEIVEFTTAGDFVGQFSVDPANGGAFGLAVGTFGGQTVLAAVDDVQGGVTVWETPQPYRPAFEVSSAAPGGPSEQNPYGIAIVPSGIASDGGLSSGNILVSNFNGATNVQGTGTTVVNVAPTGRSLFFTSALPGLSTALGVLKSGLVIVGNVPAASDGGVGMGALQVLDANGRLLSTITDATLLADPWDLAISDQGSTAKIFVSNVVTGTVTRLDATVSSTALTVTSKVQIASGYATRPDPAAFVVGPGGMVYDEVSDTLFLASTAEKVNGAEAGSVFSIAKAGTATTDGGKGTVVYADATHLHGPIGLALAPNGHLLVANSDAVNADPTQPSEIVEITTAGEFVGQFSMDPATGGAFGLAVGAFGGQTVLAAVDDVQGLLSIQNIP